MYILYTVLTIISPFELFVAIPFNRKAAFSPNNDGLNDYLNIIAKSSLKGLNYFKIFNRYGVLVYDTKEIKYGWDGRLNGIMQEADVYYWIAEYTTIDGETIKTSGQSVLIK